MDGWGRRSRGCVVKALVSHRVRVPLTLGDVTKGIGPKLNQSAPEKFHFARGHVPAIATNQCMKLEISTVSGQMGGVNYANYNQRQKSIPKLHNQ